MIIILHKRLNRWWTSPWSESKTVKMMLKCLLYESGSKLPVFTCLMYGWALKDGWWWLERTWLPLLSALVALLAESPAQSVSSGVRAPSPTPSAVSLGSEKPSTVSQDRKVPVPIGTERSARIRQTGTSTPSVIGSNLAAPVGHSGIWSFEGIGGNQGTWC